MPIFTDVDPNRWSYRDIEKAAKYGLLMGKAPGVFDPSAPVTREELAAFGVRMYEQTNEDFVEVINRVLPAVVMVQNIEQGGTGSGTIIHPDGYVLTNWHVVSRKIPPAEERGEPTYEVAKTVGFRTSELSFGYAEGPVIAYDQSLDLALVKIDLSGTYPTLPLSPRWPLLESQKVLAIGSPMGLIGSVAEGVVSAIRHNQWGMKAILIQTDAAINPGNSGGAMVNLQGELIGVPSNKLVDVAIEGLNFAIAIPTVRDFLQENAAYLSL